MFNLFFSNLKQEFNHSLIRFLLYFTKLAQLFSQNSPPNAWVFWNTYFSTWSWIRKTLRFSLESQTVLDNLLEANLVLKKNGIFNEENCNAIANHDLPKELANLFSCLVQAKILTQDNRKVLSEFKKLNYLEHIFSWLLKEGILDQDKFGLITTLSDFAESLALLPSNFLTQEIFDILSFNPNPISCAKVFKVLKQGLILDSKNQYSIALKANDPDFSEAIFILNQNRCLIYVYFDIMMRHSNPKSFAEAVVILAPLGVLTPKCLNKLATDLNPLDSAKTLEQKLYNAKIRLTNAKIHTQNNFQRVKAHSEPTDLAEAFALLSINKQLTAENVEVLSAHDEPVSLAKALIDLGGILNPEIRTLISRQKQPDVFVSHIISILKPLSLLNSRYFILSAEHSDPQNLVLAVRCLNWSSICNTENEAAIANYSSPLKLAEVLVILHRGKILTQDNRNKLIVHPSFLLLQEGLSLLLNSNILTQENFLLIYANHNPYQLARALHILNRAGILNQTYSQIVDAHANPYELALALSSLEHAGILTQDNRALVAAHANPNNLALALSYLQQVGILTQENRALVAAHAAPNHLALVLSYLQQAGILTEENRALVAARAYLYALSLALYYLQQAGILTQENFEALLAPNHAALVSNQAPELIWDRIPNHLRTQANFQRFLTAAEHITPIAELQRVVNLILGIQAAAGAGPVVAINPGQSTHTASVHASVSASAMKLMQTYGPGLNLEAKIREIKTYVNGLADSLTNQAAKRCIERITSLGYTHLDEVSRISTCQLLSLAYAAIHDDTKRTGTLDDAKILFIQGLYEIQRGYNLNAAGQDQGGEDLPICIGGTFNKLMEKLNGIHADVEVYYITHEGASLKFPRLAAAHAITYLQSLAMPTTSEDYLRIKDLLERLTADGSLEPIWENIQAGVQTALWDEFKEAYSNEPEDARFLALINNGQYAALPNLSAIITALLVSPGYQAYVEKQKRLSLKSYSLWENRHSSPQAQKEFDLKCGIILKPNPGV